MKHINHTQGFVDKMTGDNTQQVEALWSYIKRMMEEKKGVQEDKLQGFLHEALFLKKYAATLAYHEEALSMLVSEIFILWKEIFF